MQTLVRKNKSYTMTWSYEESKEREEPFNDVKVLVSLVATESSPANVEANVV